jgi:hypothetical protein
MPRIPLPPAVRRDAAAAAASRAKQQRHVGEWSLPLVVRSGRIDPLPDALAFTRSERRIRGEIIRLAGAISSIARP